MSALTKLEYESDLNCAKISLFAQCKALINEGMPAEVDQMIERARGTISDTELNKIRLIKDVALGSTALIK